MTRIFLLLASLQLFACGRDSVLQQQKLLPSYPSASAVEYLDNRIYIMGDDATHLLVLDIALNIIDSIPVFPGIKGRIPKETKPDLESMTIVKGGRLLLAGSASLIPYRYKGIIVDPASRKVDSVSLDLFFERIKDVGVKEMNIEGMTTIPGGMVLANRGHLGYRHNELLFTTPYFWEDQEKSFISRALFGYSSDSSNFQGVSGLAFSRKHDLLIATVSTENTNNAIDDGEIGRSYLWLVKGIAAKTRWKAVNPDRIIDLVSLDRKFEGQKIESVCVLNETKHFIYLLLVADNDNGSSNLFKVAIRV